MHFCTTKLRSVGCVAAAGILLWAMAGSTAIAHGSGGSKKPRKPAPIVIEEQNARTYGGTIIGDAATASLHCDHGYVEWQIPKTDKPRKLPLLMWHSSTTKTWENTFNNSEGFKNIFLRQGYSVYVVDAPRVGRAGGGCEPFTYTPNIGMDQSRFNSFRIGIWEPPAAPVPYRGVQFPARDPVALSELYRASVPEFNVPENVQLQAAAAAELLKEIGSVVLLTHSGSGSRGWATAMKSDKVRGIVAYEPSSVVWPAGEVPPPELRSDGALVVADAPLNAVVPLSEFKKLTKIPLQIVYGDNIPRTLDPANVGRRLTLDSRRINVLRSKQFAAAVNRHGGNAQVLVLPEVGVYGNTHFPMSDNNNDKVADLLSSFLKKRGLDSYDRRR